MLAGELYIATDPELWELHLKTQQILHTFNLPLPAAALERQTLLQQLLDAVGAGCEIKSPFRCNYGINIFVGERVFINYDGIILDCNTVRLGDRVLLAPKVQIYTATHPLDPAIRKDGWEFARPVEIGNDVWIGGGAIVCPGVTIGAGSVVTRESHSTLSLPETLAA